MLLNPNQVVHSSLRLFWLSGKAFVLYIQIRFALKREENDKSARDHRFDPCKQQFFFVTRIYARARVLSVP
jgi:hypothetical protein